MREIFVTDDLQSYAYGLLSGIEPLCVRGETIDSVNLSVFRKSSTGRHSEVPRFHQRDEESPAAQMLPDSN